MASGVDQEWESTEEEEEDFLRRSKRRNKECMDKMDVLMEGVEATIPSGKNKDKVSYKDIVIGAQAKS